MWMVGLQNFVLVFYLRFVEISLQTQKASDKFLTCPLLAFKKFYDMISSITKGWVQRIQEGKKW